MKAVANYVEEIHVRLLLHCELSSNQVDILLVGYVQTYVDVALLDRRQIISLIMDKRGLKLVSVFIRSQHVPECQMDIL